MAKTFVRGKNRGSFVGLVRQLPSDWQTKVMSLLESIVWRDELEDYVADSGDLIDHGDLDGLTDDDHTQYHTTARANTWFGTKDVADLAGKSHTSLTSIGSNTHTQIDTHIAHNTGHPNQKTYNAEPADGTLDNDEGVFWYENT